MVGPANTTFDNTPPSGSPGILFGFVGGDQARRFAKMSRSQRREAVLDNFVTYYGEEARSPKSSFEMDWTQEEWTRGCPVGHPSSTSCAATGPQLRKPFRHVHWAGTETADLLDRLHGRGGALGRARGEGSAQGAAQVSPRAILALGVALVAVAAPATAQAQVTPDQAAELGREAYRYGIPLLEILRVRTEMTSVARPTGGATRRSTRSATRASSRLRATARWSRRTWTRSTRSPTWT